MVWLSRNFERITGFTRSECIGRNCRFLQSDQTDPVAVSAIRRGVGDGKHVRVHVWNDGREFGFWQLLSLHPAFDQDGDLRTTSASRCRSRARSSTRSHSCRRGGRSWRRRSPSLRRRSCRASCAGGTSLRRSTIARSTSATCARRSGGDERGARPCLATAHSTRLVPADELSHTNILIADGHRHTMTSLPSTYPSWTSPTSTSARPTHNQPSVGPHGASSVSSFPTTSS